MKLGRVLGTVIATRKDKAIEGVKLYLLQPLNSRGNPEGDILVAVDGVGAREGDLVFYVRSREATLAIKGRVIPAHAGIVGIVDNVRFEEEN